MCLCTGNEVPGSILTSDVAMPLLGSRNRLLTCTPGITSRQVPSDEGTDMKGPGFSSFISSVLAFCPTDASNAARTRAGGDSSGTPQPIFSRVISNDSISALQILHPFDRCS